MKGNVQLFGNQESMWLECPDCLTIYNRNEPDINKPVRLLNCLVFVKECPDCGIRLDAYSDAKDGDN